jgi:hypothetical protein
MYLSSCGAGADGALQWASHLGHEGRSQARSWIMSAVHHASALDARWMSLDECRLLLQSPPWTRDLAVATRCDVVGGCGAAGPADVWASDGLAGGPFVEHGALQKRVQDRPSRGPFDAAQPLLVSPARYHCLYCYQHITYSSTRSASQSARRDRDVRVAALGSGGGGGSRGAGGAKLFVPTSRLRLLSSSGALGLQLRSSAAGRTRSTKTGAWSLGTCSKPGSTSCWQGTAQASPE